jgi:3',5'-cyclic AMP phosphodiesterase CpdA
MTVRILHLSDIHFGCENTAAVAAAREAAQGGGFDVITVTGDITQSGRRREFQAAREWLRLLPEPQVCTPGNHDTPYWDLVARLFWPFERYHRFIEPFFAGLSAPGLQIVSLNTSRGAQPRLNWSKGQADVGQAEAACRLLARAGPGLKVVICHHPLMEVTGGPMTGLVWGGRRASQVLAEGGVDLILTGHVHMPFAHALPFGDGRTYNVGASTLSLRERGCPAGFTVIEADEGAIQVTAQGWTGRRFEPQRSWGFDRRQPGASAPEAADGREGRPPVQAG